MALLSHTAELVGNESLEKWEFVGSGGFGRVYKARHKNWGFDVAIKLLHGGVGTLMSKDKALSAEAELMNKASCEFVLRVYGVYEGNFMQSGIVMEFMSRGSVQTLIQDLCGRPPWPLTFRLAHQVALGMNFLHSRNLIHHDLKPSNVLLNDDLNAKLADFGLSRVSTSALNSNEKKSGEVGGSYKYMPPEAFEASYEPVRAFDRYSYGILLWSIVTGKEPYPSADNHLVALSIPRGQRPSLEDINQGEAEGLKDLLELMKMCWDENPVKRPCFKECLEVTETLFSKHWGEIHVAVHHVLTTLSNTSNRHSSVPLHCFPQTTEQSKARATVNGVRVINNEKASAQDNSTTTVSDRDKAKFVDDNRAALIQHVSEVMAIVEELGNMVHTETYSAIEAEKTSREQMRALFQRTFRPGGVTVKAAFYTALKRHHPELVERLGG
ncbi:receptor-interacting serine serine/threonine-protein kinase 3-like isoform X1 [Solea senegalensis]|uniref:Receptor-interacting serine serine/threonine-protein kinase 3-like isoform X1 n=1 Tax=Solea senegalensis TaxID=28829 RepID=A0AAV6T066_SOLSE|nr:receptor-interacting serine/threonine-protein kinase 3-like isoform X2 [Solea senegalensis]KAG7522818.1 receptor-interacting serine serine/threonine-protein kinase 3-like isoform X1 [Solea senegalensis]